MRRKPHVGGSSLRADYKASAFRQELFTSGAYNVDMTRIVKKFEDRKADIVNAARRLFQTQEYDKTSMQDVIDAVGIAKGTLYHYFKSKEDLLEAVIEEIADEAIEQMQASVKEATGNALQKMQVLTRSGNIAKSHDNLLDNLHKPDNQGMHSRLFAAILEQPREVVAYGLEVKLACGRTGFSRCEASDEKKLIFYFIKK